MAPRTSAIAQALRPRGPVVFDLARRSMAGLTVLEVAGELDVLTARRLGEAVDRELRRGEEDLAIDLRQATFIDSAGLYLLLNAQRRLRRAGRALAVVCDEGPVLRVLELSRLVETFGVVPSLAAHRARSADRERLRAA